MKPRDIDDRQSSLKRARERLQHYRNQRMTFEQHMDVNSHPDHYTLLGLYEEEKKSERGVELAEQELLEARPNGGFHIVVILIAFLIITILIIT